MCGILRCLDRAHRSRALIAREASTIHASRYRGTNLKVFHPIQQLAMRILRRAAETAPPFSRITGQQNRTVSSCHAKSFSSTTRWVHPLLACRSIATTVRLSNTMEQQKAANETPTEKGAPIIDHSQNIRVATPDSTPDVWIDKLHNYLHLLVEHLNFFRVHLLVFTFVPLFLSIIFWAVNGRFKIEYIDSLFLCYSAFTSTG